MKTIRSITTFLFLALVLPAVFAQQEEQPEIIPQLVFNAMPIDQVLLKYEEYTGKTLIHSVNMPQFQVNFSSNGELTRQEAIVAIESLLALNGVAIVDMGERFAKVVPMQGVEGQVPELIDTEKLHAADPSQRVYARIFTVEHMPSQKAIELINPLRSMQTPIANFPKNNSFLLTDSLVNLQRIQNLLDTIDSATAPNETIRFFQLQRVSANDLKGRLEALRRGPLQEQFGENTVFEADERTNQLIVITHPSNIALVEEMVDQLDIDVAPLTRSEVFTVKHADSTEVASLIQQVIQGQQQARDQDGDVDRPSGNEQQQNEPQPQQANQAQPTAAAALSTEGAALQFSKYVTIVADERSNSIVAYGTPSDLTQIEQLIEKIDVLLALVRIEVVIAEVTLSEDQARGIDSFGLTLDPNNLLSTTGEYDFNVTPVSTTGLETPFGVQGSLREFSLDLVFNTARRNSNVRILQHPNITASHNQEAVISVGESRPVVTSTATELGSNDSIRSNVSFRDIGIELTVTPLIGSNGMIQMEIEQTVESVISTVTIDGNPQPIIGSRKATSFISVADNDVVILGGLQESNESETNSRIAFFGQIPLLGPLFGGKAVEGSRRELVIFIKPTIIDPELILSGQNKKQIQPQRIKERENETRQILDQYFEEGTFYKKPEPEEEEEAHVRRGRRY